MITSQHTRIIWYWSAIGVEFKELLQSSVEIIIHSIFNNILVKYIIAVSRIRYPYNHQIVPWRGCHWLPTPSMLGLVWVLLVSVSLAATSSYRWGIDGAQCDNKTRPAGGKGTPLDHSRSIWTSQWWVLWLQLSCQWIELLLNPYSSTMWNKFQQQGGCSMRLSIWLKIWPAGRRISRQICSKGTTSSNWYSTAALLFVVL